MPQALPVDKPARRYRSRVRSEQADRTRTRIVSAASRLFVDCGYRGTTVAAVAAAAGVAVPTVELLFGTKPRLLHAVLDVAIAGDDEPVAVLDRDWARRAEAATTLPDFLALVAPVLGAAQARSAGVLAAAYEAAGTDPTIDAVVTDRERQRQGSAAWLVGQVTRRRPLRAGLDAQAAVDSVWMLIDPAVFLRLTRRRGWTAERYARWVTDAIARLLTDPPCPTPPDRPAPTDREDLR